MFTFVLEHFKRIKKILANITQQNVVHNWINFVAQIDFNWFFSLHFYTQFNLIMRYEWNEQNATAEI